MSELPRPRTGLFLIACGLLIVVALLLSRAPQADRGPAPDSASRAAGSRHALALLGSLAREEARLGAVGRRFVSAFLRFEVGDHSPQVKASLWATAGAGFAAELESAPARPTGGHRAPAARIERLDISFLTETAARALLSGVARRPGGPEEFSFLFARRSGHWRALGVAE